MRPRIHESDQKRYSEPTFEETAPAHREFDEFDRSAGVALSSVNASAPRTPACGFCSIAAPEPRSHNHIDPRRNVFFADVRAHQHGARPRSGNRCSFRSRCHTRPPSREPNARLDDGTRPSSAHLTGTSRQIPRRPERKHTTDVRLWSALR